MRYHWIEWDIWDGRTRRYAILEKKIIFEKNKKNGVYDKTELWKPEVKILDEVTNRSKIFEIIGNNGESISFGHTLFEIVFSVKLPKF